MTRDGIDEVGTTATTEVLDLRDWSVSALLAAYAGILRELVQRGLIRTLNAPAGDLAETLAAKSYDGALAPNSEKSWDIRAFDGRLIQVKSRVIASTSRTKPVQFSVFRSWGFDVAIFVGLRCGDLRGAGRHRVADAVGARQGWGCRVGRRLTTHGVTRGASSASGSGGPHGGIRCGAHGAVT